MIKNYWNQGGKQKRIVIILSIILIALLFFMRDDYQPALLFIRKFIFIILLCGLVLFFGLRSFRKQPSTGKRVFTLAILGVFFGMLYFLGWQIKLYDYMKTYNVFNDLNRIQINKLPLTQNERIQPLKNIHSMGNESVGETKDVSLPHLVRVGDENKWTMAIQPTEKYYLQGMKDDTEEVFSVSSTTPFPRFSNENRIPVTFAIGESLKFSRNTYNAVVQRFNPWMLINYEPSDTYYMTNDAGQWVQVVSLIKWKGFFFPYPTFGGVMIIENGKHDASDYIERITIGKGKYITPKETQKYPFLTRQNILAENVSRLQAESLKFLGGFSDPLPWNMKTAVKIPDLEADQNQLPFVTDFNFDGTDIPAYNGLYHWFGLEPVGDDRSSLTYSIFIPADGSQQLFYYNHSEKKQGYAGISAMPSKVRESKKEYDWTVNKAVEFRPYIKDIAGRRRLFFLGTVASVSKGTGNFDGSATPDLALIDSEYRDVVWIDVKHPSGWEKEVYSQLNEAWRSSEGIGSYFVEDTKIIDVIGNENSNIDIIPVETENEYKTTEQTEIQTIKPMESNESIVSLQRKIDSIKKIKVEEKRKRLQRELDSLKGL